MILEVKRMRRSGINGNNGSNELNEFCDFRMGVGFVRCTKMGVGLRVTDDTGNGRRREVGKLGTK